MTAGWHEETSSAGSSTAAISLCALLGFLVLATSPGGLEAGDANVRFETARSWLEGRGGVLPAGIGGVQGRDGREFAYFNLTQSGVFACLLGVLRALHVPRPDTAAKFVYSIGVLPGVFAATALLLLRLSAKFWQSPAIGVLAVLLGTPLLHYSRIGQEENIIALCYALLLWGLVEIWEKRNSGWLVVGAASALAITTRVATLPTIAIVWLLVAADWRREVRSTGRLLPLIAAFLLLLAATVTAAWNWWRFGSVFETGYAAAFHRLGVPVFDFRGEPLHLVALLISPVRGLLIYAPLVILVPFCLPRLAKLDPLARRLAVAGLLLFVVNLVFFSLSGTWDGGFGWGPRYLVAPLIFLAPAIWSLPWEMKLVRGMLIVSLLVQAGSVVLPGATEDYLAAIRQEDGAPCTVWSVDCSGAWLRPRLAGRAIVNAATNRPLLTLDEGALAPVRTIVVSSDYLAPSWWPVRIAYRMHAWSPRRGLGISFVIVASAILAAYSLRRGPLRRGD
jgi:hypothetical protein